LAVSDKAAEAAPFVEFMLAALRQALLEGVSGDQVSDQVSDQVARLLQALPPGEALKASELMQRLGLAHRPTFSNNYLKPALVAGLIEMTDPASPRSPAQKYRRTGFSK
ncbi:TPA: Fic family protein, partial [Pseudomonas aeruginosa]|nr:Fic family protein [Pseudomonas aeruginosa]